MAEFTETLVKLNAGQVETDLSLHLKACITAVRDTGKQGKITLTITIDQDKKNERLISFTPDVKVKLPEPKRQASHFVLHDDTLISLEDTQMRLSFGPNAAPEPKRINVGNGQTRAIEARGEGTRPDAYARGEEIGQSAYAGYTGDAVEENL